ncbi:hypothetical protein PsorP6_010608 [Peronosclerospora sorghi]|uniref:Uncharacterized protein n=1 Tax=Peronosclerospora sorghi TaxID=230839 RepID=A0ACC0VY39_9STRA|nr:hypothetical protein PsorP6_010608 [Peronosclerospora sorghi]
MEAPFYALSYVAQNAFHHIEYHLDETANQYIQWRFQSGEDMELLAKETKIKSTLKAETRFGDLADFFANEKIALRHFYAEKFTSDNVTVCPATMAQILKNLMQKKNLPLYPLSGWGGCDRYHHDPPEAPKLD